MSYLEQAEQGAAYALRIMKLEGQRDELLTVLEQIARGACLEQYYSDRCICYSCLARAAIAKATEPN